MAKEKAKELLRDSISDLLEENDIDVDNDIDESTLMFKKTPSEITRYEEGTLQKCRERAEKVMTSLLRVYLSDGFISKSEYVQAKSNLDAMTLSKIMNQMEVSEAAISVLMDSILMGDVNPKLFDALGNLQRTFIDLVKTQTNFINNVNEETLKLSMEKGDDGVVDSKAEEISAGYKSSNQRDLMRMIRNTVDGDDKSNK